MLNFLKPTVLVINLKPIVASNERENINAAMEDYKKYTCIRFVPRTDEERYFRIIKTDATGCNSYVGYYSYLNPQKLSLKEGCANVSFFLAHCFFFSGLLLQRINQSAFYRNKS